MIVKSNEQKILLSFLTYFSIQEVFLCVLEEDFEEVEESSEEVVEEFVSNEVFETVSASVWLNC